MSRHHRLDNHPTPTLSAQSGYTHDVKTVRVKEPDEHYPKLPETDYHHDQQHSVDHSPGPFAGDDLVTQQDSVDSQPGYESTVYFDDVNIIEAKKARLSFKKPPAVDVNIIGSEVKSRRVTHQIPLPQQVLQGQAIRVIGKDVTRKRLFIQLFGAVGDIAVLISPDIDMSLPKATIGQFGFPITSTPFRLDSEEEVWVMAASDNSAPVYVSFYAEYVRSADNREEYYNG